MSFDYGKLGLLLGGALLGSYGAKILGSETMKTGYTHATAAVLRMKDEVVKDYTTLKENCGDIVADAKDINEERAAKQEARMIQDAKDFLAAQEETDAAK